LAQVAVTAARLLSREWLLGAMIIYDNRDIYFIIFRRAGSVLFTKIVIVLAVMSTVLCLGLFYASQDHPVVLLSSNVSRIYSTILGFVIVFRTQLAFGRFFEGISHVQMLFSKWRDGFNSVMAFIECSIAEHAKANRRKPVEDLLLSKARLLHWFTLLSALSVQGLQEADELNSDFTENDEKFKASNRLCIIKELSNGMLAFSMAKIKISTVPFPFPFAQVLSYALYAFYVLCPFIMLEVMEQATLDQITIPLLLTFATCAGYGAVNEIAIELEARFGFDANDYPVNCQQTVIVQAMEDTYYASIPKDFSFEHFQGEPSLYAKAEMPSAQDGGLDEFSAAESSGGGLSS